jgi:hypothetical protein
MFRRIRNLSTGAFPRENGRSVTVAGDRAKTTSQSRIAPPGRNRVSKDVLPKQVRIVSCLRVPLVHRCPKSAAVGRCGYDAPCTCESFSWVGVSGRLGSRARRQSRAALPLASKKLNTAHRQATATPNRELVRSSSPEMV